MVSSRRFFRPINLSFFLLLLMVPRVSHATDFLSGTFWWESEPFVGGVDYPQNEEEAVKYLLEEARWIFSGMIYGFSVNYTPPDRSREIEQVFEMVPIGTIPWGDPALRIITGWRKKDRHYSDIGFSLEGVNLLRRQAWESNIHPQAAGQGSYTQYEGFSGRRKAVEGAVLNAVREYYRERIGTRPSEIRGEIALFQAPSLVLREGAYHARVRICMNLEITGQAAF